MGMFDDVLDKVGEPYTGGGKGFKYGTHPVLIMLAEAKQKKTKNNDKSEVIEVTVADKADEERTATCTLYFHTEGGARMSVTKVLGLLVHKVSEEKKDKVRELGKKLFGSITDPVKARDVALGLINEKLVGAEAFLFADPQGKYDTTKYGDIWHYPYEDPNADTRGDESIPLNGEDISDTGEAENIPDFDL